jgi:hypothetical protein
MTSNTRVPKAEITGAYGALLKRSGGLADRLHVSARRPRVRVSRAEGVAALAGGSARSAVFTGSGRWCRTGQHGIPCGDALP